MPRGAEATFTIADLTQPPTFDAVIGALGGPVDVFIHNAGINAVGHFAHSDLAKQQAVFQLNFLAPLHLTARLLNQQLINAGGTLVFISSLSRYVSYPGAAVYGATKDGLASYARSLRVALAKDNIHVLTVYPGPTRTAHARRYSPDNSREQARMSPEVLADKIFQAAERRKAMLIPGFSNQLFGWLGHYFPGLTEWMMRQVILEKLSP